MTRPLNRLERFAAGFAAALLVMLLLAVLAFAIVSVLVATSHVWRAGR